MREPLVVLPDARVQDAIAQMSGCSSRRHPSDGTIDSTSKRLHRVRCSCVLVVQDGHLIGILTERDIVLLAAQQVPLEHLLVQQVMSSPVITLRESALTDLALVIRQFQEHQIRHLPIVNEQNRVVGLLAQDCLQVALFEYQAVEQQLHQRNQIYQTLEAKFERRTQQLWHLTSMQQAIIDAADYAIISTDLNGMIQTLNVAAERMLGYAATELVGHATPELIHDRQEVIDRAASLSQELGQMIAPGIEVFLTKARQGIVSQEEWTYIRKDGSRLPVLLSIRALHDTNQQMIGFLGIAKDSTESKRAELERQQLIQELSAFKLGLDQSALVTITDAQGVIAYVNDRFCEISGYGRHELLGRTHRLVKSNCHPPGFYQELWATISRGQIWRGEMCNRAKNGSFYWVESTLVPFLDAEGRPFQYLAIRFDITARKQAEVQLQRTNEELARATRLKDEFLANMSHELRTPLNAILGMTEGLQEAIFGKVTEPQRQALQTIERSGSHLLELINDILDVAKIESGQLELVYAPTAIAPLCQSSLVFIKQQALKKQIHLEVKLAANLPDLLIDELRIRQVLINLLNNAVKFTPEGGRITLDVSLQKQATPLKPLPIQGITRVRVYRTPLEEELGLGPQLLPLSNTGMVLKDYLRIAVSDTGIGIAPEYINRLFQPFVQIDSALNRQYTGTGLGLTLVKRIVELHGGQVEFTSKVGFGSCFTIHLPYVPAGTTLLEPGLHPAPRSDFSAVELESSPLILLAEDNEANVEMMAGYLAAKGYRLRLAGTGEEALALALAEAPDLILMDIQMPGMDGLEAMQQIRQRAHLAQVPMIALTALAMPGDRDRCLAAGANYYLTKPVKLKQLVSLIQQCLPVASPEPRSISP